MRFTALSLVALVLLAMPAAAAENPDGPTGMLTVDGSFAPMVGHGGEPDPGDESGSDLRIDVLAPVANWLTLGVETQRRAFSNDFGDGSWGSWEVYVGIRARVHFGM